MYICIYICIANSRREKLAWRVPPSNSDYTITFAAALLCCRRRIYRGGFTEFRVYPGGNFFAVGVTVSFTSELGVYQRFT